MSVSLEMIEENFYKKIAMINLFMGDHLSRKTSLYLHV